MAVVTERRDASPDHVLSERLAPLRRTLEGLVASGSVEAMVTLVDDGTGHPIVDRYGADGDPDLMGRDSRVGVGDLTTTFTTATALLLVEDGAIELHDPVGDLLPELAGRPVLRTIGAHLDDTVPVSRSLTVSDLLRSRSGTGAGPAAAPGTPVRRAARSLGLGVFDPTDPTDDLGIDEWLRRLGTLPLLHQPDERRLERADAMVLGALVERLTGKPLPEVMRDRLLGPLHLVDTSFDPAPGTPPPGRFTDGASGLVSTLDDLWRFAAALVDGGRGGDALRVLSRVTVHSMLVGQERVGRYDDAAGAGEADAEWGLGLRAAATHRSSSTRSASTRSTEPLPTSRGFGMDANAGPGTGGDGAGSGRGDGAEVTWRSNPDTGATAILIARPAASRRSPSPSTTFWHRIDLAGL